MFNNFFYVIGTKNVYIFPRFGILVILWVWYFGVWYSGRSGFQYDNRKIFKDLDRYYKTVDDSIIEFHQHKMEQINSILSELWARVYQGNDIETIKIKSQTVGSAEKKKSYDYRFVLSFYFLKKFFKLVLL